MTTPLQTAKLALLLPAVLNPTTVAVDRFLLQCSFSKADIRTDMKYFETLDSAESEVVAPT